MNNTTGQALDGIAHIRQSVRDILTTPLGSRVMRRDYGSLLPELLDQPLNQATLLRVYAASIMALIRWEPRIRVQSIRRRIDSHTPGKAVLAIEALTTSGENTTLEVSLS